MAKSNILGNVLQGVASGWLNHQSERKKTQDEQKRYDLQESRRLKDIERAKKQEEERYKRNRRDRLNDYNRIRGDKNEDEQRRYDLQEGRTEDKYNAALERVIGKKNDQGLYVGGTHSDMANKDPDTVANYKAKLRKDPVPEQPANKAVADLVFSHRWDEALAAARTNPKDYKFVIDSYNMYSKSHPVARPTTPQPSNIPGVSAKDRKTTLDDYKRRISLVDSRIKDKDKELEPFDISQQDNPEYIRLVREKRALLEDKNKLANEYDNFIQGKMPDKEKIRADFSEKLNNFMNAIKKGSAKK